VQKNRSFWQQWQKPKNCKPDVSQMFSTLGRLLLALRLLLSSVFLNSMHPVYSHKIKTLYAQRRNWQIKNDMASRTVFSSGCWSELYRSYYMTARFCTNGHSFNASIISSVSTGPGSGPLWSNIASVLSQDIFGPDSIHMWHVLCCFCLFHINHTSHQPQESNWHHC